jgi:diguanylate cyclase (GGDEF)-like protein
MLGVEEFEKLFEQEWRRATREPKPVSLIKVSIDRFKTYEEQEGPRRSLHCLERVAAELEAELKKAGQLLASAGNEEFFVLLPETHPGTATGIADAMRKSVEAMNVPHPNGSKVTVSLGVVTAFPYRLSDPDALVESIDKALQAAQSRGGNRVVTVPLLGG